MNWTLFGILGTILAFAGYIWYSIRKQALSEEEVASQSEARKAEADKRLALEIAASKEEQRIREQEAKNAKEVVDSHDVDRARELLKNAWKDRNLN